METHPESGNAAKPAEVRDRRVPPRGVLPPDLDTIGEAYVRALCEEIRLWLTAVPKTEPLGVLFSGGADSGALLLCLYHELLASGQSPARLKAFTLAVGGGGEDLEQARELLRLG